MKIEKKLLDRKFYGDKRPQNIKYIVIQDINNNSVTHYYIADGVVTQIVPDENMTDSVNGGKLNRRGYLHGICTKYNSLSVGLPNNMSKDDEETCIRLIMTLKQRYDIKNDNIVRKMDITGELNPMKWHDNEKWNKDIKGRLIDIKKTEPK